jgi:sensitive to high expression protein 9
MPRITSDSGAENLVKARRVAIEDAKQALDVAMHQQASSQKEVVALLERKHSWSATDLERYMSLIRSEHVNDQAVREAKEAIAAAENALEDARAQLERRERAQYHEEQIWSDTIRRNSTWVTFGLMGLNIFLLLTSLVIFEPWRRRRMVREVKNALEAHKAALEPTVAALPPALALETSTPAPSSEPQVPAPTAVAETEVDRALEAGEAVEVKESATTTTLPTTSPQSLKETDPAMEQSAQVPEAIPAASPDTISDSEALGAALLTPDGVVPQEAINIDEEVKVATDEVPQTWQEKVTYIAHDAISDRAISMRRVDFTTAILQSAAAGAVIAAAAIALCVRPR